MDLVWHCSAPSPQHWQLCTATVDQFHLWLSPLLSSADFPTQPLVDSDWPTTSGWDLPWRQCRDCQSSKTASFHISHNATADYCRLHQLWCLCRCCRTFSGLWTSGRLKSFHSPWWFIVLSSGSTTRCGLLWWSVCYSSNGSPGIRNGPEKKFYFLGLCLGGGGWSLELSPWWHLNK